MGVIDAELATEGGKVDDKFEDGGMGREHGDDFVRKMATLHDATRERGERDAIGSYSVQPRRCERCVCHGQSVVLEHKLARTEACGDAFVH